ncbi:ATP-dependent nuclease [Prescottella equi]|uniref:ATP-dependent nuclease n=1 Tax=Rhodococcus hoagii TaxID=43767 RepID=UPI001C73FEDD|nr:ATP-binding protein [Prescottella equi]BCN78115.1 hypothetical protein RE0346_17750 [Prescottella equi]
MTNRDGLAKAWAARKFEPQVHHIRFPNFRNLDPSVEIRFEYPITAIVGPNGTNKTSILRALQGCPKNKNIGIYWFGTALDQIPSDERNQFVYGRWSNTANGVVEMLKMRVRRRDSRTGEIDPDYFEPSEPTIAAGMTPLDPIPDGSPTPSDRSEDRWNLLEKNVVYLDFRSEISAFDKYFFHHDYQRRPKDRGGRRVAAMRRRKELIRDNSEKLKRILDGKKSSYKQGGSEWVIAKARFLSDEELAAVSEILDREYSSIEVVTHKAFRVTGTTARMRTREFRYSEAWAGSGEFAVVQLVTAIISAPPYSLIILDEPEVSLHPGAQRRLMSFVSAQSLRNKHQVVFATHSPMLIEDLPSCAVKVLTIDPITGKVRLRSQHSSSREAFNALEHRFKRKTIVVEDALAAEIVKRAIRIERPERIAALDIVYYPGGENDLRCRDLTAWARHSETNVLLFLDGDAFFEVTDPATVSPADLKDVCARIVGGEKALAGIPMDSGASPDDGYRKIIGWSREYVQFLPGGQPEHWLRERIEGLQVSTTGDSKWWWVERATTDLGLSDSEGEASSISILAAQQRELASLDDSLNDLKWISKMISEFLERS